MVPTLVRDAIRAAAGARRTHHDRAAVAISSPQPRRRVTLPRNVAGGRRPEPYSRADAPFFRSPGFFVRIGGLAIIVGVALCVLVLRAWSIQVLHGPQYTSLANGQAYRTVDLAGPRGAIVDSKRRKLADTTGHVVIAADVAAIGNIDKTGWHASADGLASLRQLSKLAHVPVHTLIVRIKRSVVRSPFAPATVLPHPVAGLIDYLDERSSDYPGFKTTIDARLQRAAEKAIKNGVALARENGHADANAAAAVVMNPRTGAIYALASYPTYNQVAASRDPQYLASLYKDRGANPRLLNQATQGQYPTGSTFKPIVAEAALSEGLITPYTPQLCSGSFTIGGFTFHNVEAGVYSSMSLPTALAESCDTWFYRLGDKFFLAGSQGIQRWAHQLGLGHPTGFDVPGEAHGIVPTPAWLRKTWQQS